MRALSSNALGSLYMTLASIGYVVNDGAVRRITEEGPDVYQVLCVRSLVLVALFIGGSLVRNELPKRSHFSPAVAWRVAAEVLASALFFAAVVRLEFANVQALIQIVPFAVILVAAFVLRESVRPGQYVAVALGFIGVVIIVRPATDGFSYWSLAVLATALLLVVRELATRRVDPSIPTSSIAFATALGLALLTGALSVAPGWHAFNTTALAFLALSAVSLIAGYIFSIETVRVGDLSVSAPFRYTVLVGAVIVGYVMFGEVPDTYTLVGSAIIVASGLYALHLEHANGRTGRTRAPR